MRKLGIVVVGSLPYQVYEASEEEHRPLEDAVGVTDCTKSTIHIRAGMSRELALETLAHEIGHAAFYGSGAGEYLKTLLYDADKAHEAEEMLILMLTPSLLAVRGQLKGFL